MILLWEVLVLEEDMKISQDISIQKKVIILVCDEVSDFQE